MKTEWERGRGLDLEFGGQKITHPVAVGLTVLLAIPAFLVLACAFLLALPALALGLLLQKLLTA